MVSVDNVYNLNIKILDDDLNNKQNLVLNFQFV